MTDQETLVRFVQLRAEGRSFARIADELNVSKPTLIKWSRKFQFEIHNQRAILLEAVQERWLHTREERVATLGAQLQQVEAELARRNIGELSTPRLFALAATLRRQIQAETGQLRFTSPIKEIPDDEYCEQVQDWQP
jgi:transposase